MALIGKVSNGRTDYFFSLLDMALVNAFIIYRESTRSPFSLFDFRREVGLGLLTNVTVEIPFAAKGKKVSYSVADFVRLGNVGVHFPLFNQPKATCEVCSKQNIKSRPTSKYNFCGINLCYNTNKNCITTYHTQKKGVARFLRFHVCSYSLC